MHKFLDMPFWAEFTLSDNIHKTRDGFLICQNVNLAKVGTQEYYGREINDKDRYNDRVTVHRLPEDVFSKETLSSLEGKPVTDDHPGDNEGMVDPNNSGRHIKGHVQNIRIDGDYIVGDLMIMEANLISKVESGAKREVSAGYTARLVPYKDGYKQTAIHGNHVAIVSKGRAGPEAKIIDHKLDIGERKPMKPEEIRAQMLASFVKDANPSPTDLAAAIKLLDEEAEEKEKETKDAEEEKEEKEVKDKSLFDKALSLFQKDKAAEKESNAFADALKEITSTLGSMQAEIKALKDAKEEEAETKDAEDEEEDEAEKETKDDAEDGDEMEAKDSAMAILQMELAPHIAKLSDSHAKPIKDALAKAAGRKPSAKKAYSTISKTVAKHKDKTSGWNPFNDAAAAVDDGSSIGQQIKEKYNAQSQKKA